MPLDKPRSPKPRIPIPKDKIAEFCQSNHIKSLALFGSVLTDLFSDSSDVDVLVEFDSEHIPGFFKLVDMEDEFELIVGRKADIRTPRDLSPYFREDVIKKAYPVYGKQQFHSHLERAWKGEDFEFPKKKMTVKCKNFCN